jgi:hypothetical protein
MPNRTIAVSLLIMVFFFGLSCVVQPGGECPIKKR